MRRISSGRPWEDLVGYSRAVVAGNLVFISGTTATDANGAVIAPGDAYLQTKAALSNLLEAVERAGGVREDIVRTRLFVTDIERWREYGRAHAEVFRDVRPATSMVEVSRLIHPDMVVEVEAIAALGLTRP